MDIPFVFLEKETCMYGLNVYISITGWRFSYWIL